MGLIDITDRQGRRWVLDQEGLYILVRTAMRADMIRKRTRIVEDDPGIFLPTTYQCVTNYHGLRNKLNHEAPRLYNELAVEIAGNPSGNLNNLAALVASARGDQAWLREQQRSAVRRGMANVTRVVSNWETTVETTRFVRDASAATVVALSAPIGGAAGFGALAVGSTMRGAFTYQDTGNVGAAVISGTGTFVVGAMGMGPISSAGSTMSSMTSEYATLVVVQAGTGGMMSATQSYIEGNDMRTAAQSGLNATMFGLIGGVAGVGMQNMSLPASMTQTSFAREAISAGVSGLQDAAGGVAGNAMASPRAANTPEPPPRPRGQLTFGGLPANASGDAEYVRTNVLRQVQ